MIPQTKIFIQKELSEHLTWRAYLDLPLNYSSAVNCKEKSHQPPRSELHKKDPIERNDIN